ncbi:MAG: FG-GAP repeat domain-containing protein, partial [Rudaea sp.]
MNRTMQSVQPGRRLFAIACVGLYLLGVGMAHSVDLIGNGRSDVLWRLPAGNPLIWEMSGLSQQAQLNVPVALDAGSAIAGAGKFFGKDTPAAIVWINSSDQLSLWQIGNGGDLQQACTVAGGIDPNLDFLGIGDINGDGTDDVVWRNSVDNSVVAFLMDGCNAPQTLTLPDTADPAWTFAGVGDVNGDGTADLLWLDDQSNTLVEWLTGAGGTITQHNLDEGGQSGWQVAAVADFDDNGQADILWRDPASNNLTLWLMNGASASVHAVTASSSSTFAASDDIFNNGFDTGSRSAPTLSADWTILGATDFNGDGDADILLADTQGNTAIWQMQGATVQVSGLFPPTSPDMPLTGLTGWRLPLDRPTITKVDGQVTVDWSALPGSVNYTVYRSATNDPANTGSVVSSAPPPFSFACPVTGCPGSDRYFAVSAAYHGIELPPSKEAYVVEFTPVVLPYWGAMAVTNLDDDGCTDILGALGDCHGGFTLESESSIGLGALRASGRVYRDVRFADFNGDGILDAIANVYSCDVPECGANDTTSRIQLYFGNGDGTFTEDSAFDALNVPGGGFGETIVVADFNNDGYLDVFLPKYTAYDSSEHNFLLINDGSGNFTDVSDTAGVAMRDVPLCGRPEGAQAIDLNSDGRIDLYAGSHLFINEGNNSQDIPLFQNMGPTIAQNCSVVMQSPWGLPEQFDEGAKFIDLDNSGQLSLALNAVYSTLSTSPGIVIWTFDGVGTFTQRAVVPLIFLDQSFGLNAADLAGSGRSDLIVAGGCDSSDPIYGDAQCYLWGKPHALPQFLSNDGGQFTVSDFYDDGLLPTQRGWDDLQTFADFDNSGTIDWVSRFGDTRTNDDGYLDILMSRASSLDTIVVTILGNNGEHNQQGRV